jgi:hypothetical protein
MTGALMVETLFSKADRFDVSYTIKDRKGGAIFEYAGTIIRQRGCG